MSRDELGRSERTSEGDVKTDNYGNVTHHVVTAFVRKLDAVMPLINIIIIAIFKCNVVHLLNN